MACSGRETARHLAERACARARAASAGGVWTAPSGSPPPTPQRESGSRHLAPTPLLPPPPAPAEPPFPFLHFQPSHPAPIQACPGPQQQKPHHLYPHTLHAGRAAVPTSVLKAEVVGGVGGRCGGGRGGRGWESGGKPRDESPVSGPRPREDGRGGLPLVFVLEGVKRGTVVRGRRWPGAAPWFSRGVWSWLLTPPRRLVGVGRGELGRRAAAGVAGVR